jgi:MFS family permease
MKRSPLPVILLTVFIDLVGFGIVIPILPYYAKEYGASAVGATALLSIFSAAQFLMAPLWGRFSDQVGRRPVLLFAMTATATSYVVMGLAPTLAWLFIARAGAGAAGGSISAAQAYMADITAPEDRAKGMGLIGAAFGLGFILGPAIGGILTSEAPRIGAAIGGSVGGYVSVHHIALPMFFAAALSGVNILMALVRLPESLSPELRRMVAGRRVPRFRALAGALARPHLRSLLAVFGLATIGFSMMESTFALFMKERLGLNASQVAYVFVFVGLLAVIVQGGLISRLTRRFGEWRLLPVGLATVSVGLLGLTQAGSLGAMLLTSAFIAIGNALTTPSLNALISRTAAAHEQGGTLGVSQSVGALSRILGPLLGGALFGLSVTATYVGGAVLLLCALAVTTLTSPRASPNAESIAQG